MGDGEKRILVVDDEPAIRTLLLTILKRRGFEVDTAANGSEAVDRCMRCRYAVVLLDLMMPVMSGWDFLAQIELMEERPLIIVLTAGSLPRQLNPAVVAGTLRKPFDMELLVDTVNGCLSITRESRQKKGCPPADSHSAPATRNE
jgi:DNA-binding response OmpR family regulator